MNNQTADAASIQPVAGQPINLDAIIQIRIALDNLRTQTKESGEAIKNLDTIILAFTSGLKINAGPTS